MRFLETTLLAILLVGCAGTDPASQTSDARTSTEDAASDPRGAMATAANPYAVSAAADVLRRGGHAVDAAIAAHAVLGLVEPQSSGLGGGGFMLVYESDDKEVAFLDGRETAPSGARVDMFMQDGEVMDFLRAWQSGRSVGVPGVVALYEMAHERYGRLPWPELFEPAIELASNGFEVSPRLAGMLPRMAEITRLDEDPGAAAYFFPGGEPLAAGDVRVNEAYAATLRRIAAEGARAFYRGDIARAIADAARAAPDGGTLTAEDMATYEAIERDPVCGGFRAMTICSAAPPSSGAMQIMMARLYDLLAMDAGSFEEKIVAFVDAQRLAYADRDYYFGDPDRIDVPVAPLLDPEYLRHRASEAPAPDEVPAHGDPGRFMGGESMARWGVDTTIEAAGTTHLSVVDAEGNAVSFTASVEAPFGSARWVRGFLLNNELTDFAREVDEAGTLPANAIAPGARPRSSMSPTIVLDADEDLLMLTGSPGGNSIPAYTQKTILATLDWGLGVQEAVDFPNIVARGLQVRVETGVPRGPALAEMLAAKGYHVQEREGENSGLHVIMVRQGRLVGAADSRREGTVQAVVREPR